MYSLYFQYMYNNDKKETNSIACTSYAIMLAYKPTFTSFMCLSFTAFGATSIYYKFCVFFYQYFPPV
jgi:hypothetical protein